MHYQGAKICVQVTGFDKETCLHKVFGFRKAEIFQHEIDLHSMVAARLAQFIDLAVDAQHPSPGGGAAAPDGSAFLTEGNAGDRTSIPSDL